MIISRLFKLPKEWKIPWFINALINDAADDLKKFDNYNIQYVLENLILLSARWHIMAIPLLISVIGLNLLILLPRSSVRKYKTYGLYI